MLSSIASLDRFPHPLISTAPGLESLEELFTGQPIQTLCAGEATFWEGDAVFHVMLVVDGCLRLYRILPDGRRVIMGFAFKGEILGLSSPRVHASTAEAVMSARVAHLPKKRFYEAVDQSPMLRPRLLTHVCNETSAAHRHMIVLGCFNADQRLASFLLSAARRIGTEANDPVVVHLPMTWLDTADYLGITLETVSRTLSKFKRAGIVEGRDRQRIVLRKMSRLQHLAGWSEDEEDHSIAHMYRGRNTSSH